MMRGCATVADADRRADQQRARNTLACRGRCTMLPRSLCWLQMERTCSGCLPRHCAKNRNDS